MNESNDFRAYAEAKRHFFGFFRARQKMVRDEERSFMVTGEKLAVQHAGGALEVRSWGAGPVVLLVHGIFSSGGAFRSLVPQLVKRNRRAVALDAPGHGESPGMFVYNEEVADAILSVKAAVGPLAATVGHSLGATWSLNATRGGLDAGRMVCMSTVAATASVCDFYAAQKGLEPPVAAHLKRLINAFSPLDAHSPMRIVAELSVPGLVVHDEDDPLARFEDGAAMASAWRGSRTLWTKRLGHTDVLHDPKVLEAVADFVA